MDIAYVTTALTIQLPSNAIDVHCLSSEEDARLAAQWPTPTLDFGDMRQRSDNGPTTSDTWNLDTKQIKRWCLSLQVCEDHINDSTGPVHRNETL